MEEWLPLLAESIRARGRPLTPVGVDETAWPNDCAEDLAARIDEVAHEFRRLWEDVDWGRDINAWDFIPARRRAGHDPMDLLVFVAYFDFEPASAPAK